MPPQPQIAEALARGATLLTPNERSARDFRAQFPATAAIHSVNAWLHSLWSTLILNGTEPRLLLNPTQEHFLWRQVIESGPEVETMGTLDSLATLAATAWSLAAAYALTPDLLRRAANTHDTATFAAWSDAFRRRCEKQQLLSTAELPAALVSHFEAGRLPVLADILILSLANLKPTSVALLDTLGERGANITHVQISNLESFEGPQPTADSPKLENEPAGSDVRVLIAAETPQQEITHAAHWLRSFIEARAAAGQPHRVGVLVPKLAETRDALEATFREILAPELEDIAADTSSAPYTFSAGPTLAQTPILATALDLLRWATGPLDTETISALLLSPYIGTVESLPARATFDAYTLRTAQVLRPELHISGLARIALQRSSRTPAAPAVMDLLQALMRAANKLTAGDAPRSHAEITDRIRTFLKSASWPGDRPLNAADFTLTRAWDHALDAVATLDFSGSRTSLTDTLEALNRQTRETQAPVPTHDAPVEIMTPAEAAGSRFDAILFLDATDTNWPAPERPHPLLPYQLQRERRMPGTDAALVTARAEEYTRQLAAASPRFLCSFAQQDADGKRRVSPLITRLNLVPQSVSTTPVPTPQITEDIVADSTPLPPLPPGQLRGGATVLELQAACAFHAFAALRLNANAPEGAVAGFDAAELGNFLHKTLDSFWSQVRTQAALRAMTLDQRRAALETAIAAAAARQPIPETRWDAAYLTLQKTRMADVLMHWLEHELQRGPFEVQEHEKERELAIGPLNLKVRLDRLDKVDGGTLLVDYKTGNPGDPKDWLSERPKAPQLPLYALLPGAEDLLGLAFAKVRAGNGMKWHGMAPPDVIKKAKPYTDLDAQREEWRVHLTQLAQQFFDGDADVSPLDYPATCTYCAHRLLCRITAPSLAPADDDNASSDEEVNA